MAKSAQIEGPDGMITVHVGDLVSYKDDIETYGEILKIENGWLTLKNGHTGNITDQEPSRCWDE
ncbi:MAG: hypothetical protein DRQ62_10285 [Gammaproteobacteria bacterium]|nr:MAG: hypothetical protein DRQ62_10285 [Gammaproteobacteria bacterium]